MSSMPISHAVVQKPATAARPPRRSLKRISATAKPARKGASPAWRRGELNMRVRSSGARHPDHAFQATHKRKRAFELRGIGDVVGEAHEREVIARLRAHRG